MAASSSTSPFFGFVHEALQNHQLQQKQQLQINKMPSMESHPPPPSSETEAEPVQAAPPPQKKRRSQLGHPYPDAEVIALSPKTLMATNRFVCEVCNKGFQREQNLQLHRRGHNLPWKLKQKTNKEVRRRVYLCPEPTCVHHDPSRALGDLTGIKKHFSRKHGEKKWKCDKCSKRYAVQSDWKAHSKTCGTREYRCDCGTLFSRRDSFITHRAFCDALAQESFTLPTRPHFNTNNNNNNNNNNNILGISLPQLNPHLPSLQDPNPSSGLASMNPFSGAPIFNPLPNPQPSSLFAGGSVAGDFHQKPLHNLNHLSANLFGDGFYDGSNPNPNVLVCDQFHRGDQLALFGNPLSDNMNNGAPSSLFNHAGGSGTIPMSEPSIAQMSATAMLQKAAEIGSTTTTGLSGDSGTGGFGVSKPIFDGSDPQMQEIMNSLGLFGGGPVGFAGWNPNEGRVDQTRLQQVLTLPPGADRLTRDFLGVGGRISTSLGDDLARRDPQRHLHMDHCFEVKSDPHLEN